MSLGVVVVGKAMDSESDLDEERKEPPKESIRGTAYGSGAG